MPDQPKAARKQNGDTKFDRRHEEREGETAKPLAAPLDTSPSPKAANAPLPAVVGDPPPTEPEVQARANDGKAGNFATFIVVLAVVATIVGPAIYDFIGLQEERMVIVTAATMQQDTTWLLNGRVLIEGAPVRARVWAIATDDQGNRFAPPAIISDSTGAYRFAAIPARIAPAADNIARRVVSSADSNRVTSEVTVFARQVVPDSVSVRTISETVRLSASARTRWVRLPPSALLTVVFIFALTVIAGIAQGKPGGVIRKIQYYGTVILAFLMTATMVALISLGLRHVNLTGMQGDVIALGFANIHKGTYVRDVAPEWLFSLTAPYISTSGDAIATGFGAPLWALLLACFGAGVFTIRLVVKQVQTPVKLTDDKQFRARLQELVRHQFYILFAPVAAVFVYQLLVAAGAASQPTTVGFVMLAAGLVLNNVLDRAVIAARGALETNDPVSATGAGAPGGSAEATVPPAT